MKKYVAILLLAILLQGCAHSTNGLTKDGEQTAQPYGWANPSKENKNFTYNASVGNIVWSVILSETLIVPVVLTGWYLFEPVEAIK